MTTVQLDMFEAGETDRRQAEREAWAARFERAERVGWVCPGCGDVEPTAAVLASNHGIDPDVPRAGMPGECIAQFLRRNNATYRARQIGAAA